MLEDRLTSNSSPSYVTRTRGGTLREAILRQPETIVCKQHERRVEFRRARTRLYGHEIGAQQRIRVHSRISSQRLTFTCYRICLEVV